MEDSSVRQDNDLRGKGLKTEDVVCRTFVLKMAFQSNMTMGQLQPFKPALDAKGDPNPSIGHASNLVSDLIALLKKEEKEKMRQIIQDSHDVFSVPQ